MKIKNPKRNITYRTRRAPLKFMGKEFCSKCSHYMMMFYIKDLLKHK